MGKFKLFSRAVMLLGLLGMGCGNPCDDLKCDNCSDETLEDACLLTVAVDNSDACQNMLDAVPSCQ